MKRQLGALMAVAVGIIISAQPAAAFAPNTTAATQALAWLHGVQGSDGSIGANATRTEETIVGLVANHQSVAAFTSGEKTPIDYLAANIASEEKTAGNIANLIMAVAAAEKDPTSFAGHNLLQDLQCSYDAQTGSYNAQLFNDALAVLALPAHAAPAKATGYLINQQQADGGWEFQSGFGSDTNTTAVVLMALAAAGDLPDLVKERALAYFKTHQKPSGGFEYSAPFAPPGDSDPNSDALVIEALLALDLDPTSTAWSVGDKTAVSDLLTFQYQSGGFGFTRPGTSSASAPDAASTTQALPALASTFLPVRRTTGSMPAGCPTAAATASPPPAPSGPRTLPQTGGTPLPAIVLGLVSITIGWRIRRRRAG